MDIYAKPGTHVKFIEDNPTKAQIQWGNHANPSILEVGRIYTIERTDVRSSHTKVYLKEFPDIHFNSVWFSVWFKDIGKQDIYKEKVKNLQAENARLVECINLQQDKIARLCTALNDAINRPMGVVPDSAVEFYEANK